MSSVYIRNPHMRKGPKGIMINLGRIDEGAANRVDDLRDLNPAELRSIAYGGQRPEKMPHLSPGQSILCRFDQAAYVSLIVCETLDDMQSLYERYAAGQAVNITWSFGTVKPAADTISLAPSNSVVEAQIDAYGGNLSNEVQEAIRAYSMGEPGAAEALLAQQESFATAQDVKAFVGWPLSEHSQERAGEIWDRHKRSQTNPQN